MGRHGNPVLETLFEISADAHELDSNFKKHGGEAVCGSWGNCLRRFNEYRKAKQQPPPSTPADAAKTGSTKSASGSAKSGKAVAKTVRKPSRMVAEDDRRKTVWKEQYDELHAKATKEVQEAKSKQLLGSTGHRRAHTMPTQHPSAWDRQ